MKRYELTRKEAGRELSGDSGQLAERIAAEQYSGMSQFGVENFDISDSDTGQLGEVKSTATELSSGAKGRFRLWKQQHEKLLRADREGSARYVFVLFDVSSRPVVAQLKQKVPSDIGRKIGARGGWNQSGHPSGPQYKLPIEAVF